MQVCPQAVRTNCRGGAAAWGVSVIVSFLRRGSTRRHDNNQLILLIWFPRFSINVVRETEIQGGASVLAGGCRTKCTLQARDNIKATQTHKTASSKVTGGQTRRRSLQEIRRRLCGCGRDISRLFMFMNQFTCGPEYTERCLSNGVHQEIDQCSALKLR